MPDDFNQPTTQQAQAPAQTVNSAPSVPTEISALARHREAQKARTSSVFEKPENVGGLPRPSEGQPQVQDSQQPPRQPYIPRDRFDEVLKQRDSLQTKVQEFQDYIQRQQLQAQQQGTPGQGMAQSQGLTQQQQTQVSSFLDQVTKDPNQKKEWQRRITNEGIGALAEFVVKAVEDRGRPLLAEYAREINARITPLQRSLVTQQVNSYVSQRQSDPEFAVAQPVFNQLVNTAASRGYDVTNPQVLGSIEYLARQQTQSSGIRPQAPAQMPQVVPFSERPGNTGQGFGRSAARQLTPQESAIAQRFNMTPQQYLGSLQAMGVEQ
jgi:hypothetical protein